jgi:hypothetical protein
MSRVLGVTERFHAIKAVKAIRELGGIGLRTALGMVEKLARGQRVALTIAHSSRPPRGRERSTAMRPAVQSRGHGDWDDQPRRERRTGARGGGQPRPISWFRETLGFGRRSVRPPAP